MITYERGLQCVAGHNLDFKIAINISCNTFFISSINYSRSYQWFFNERAVMQSFYAQHGSFHHKCIGYSMDCNISHWKRQVRIRNLRGNAVWR